MLASCFRFQCQVHDIHIFSMKQYPYKMWEIKMRRKKTLAASKSYCAMTYIEMFGRCCFFNQNFSRIILNGDFRLEFGVHSARNNIV